MSYYASNKSKTILITVVTVCVVLAVLGGVFAIFGAKGGTTLDFTIGGLTEIGTYEETNETLYTKEAIEIDDAFRVKLTFDSTIKYQVFFYDELDTFIESTEVYTASSNPIIPEGATHFRVEITPIWDAELKADERVISVFDIHKYAKQLKVEVVDTKAEAEA